MNKGEKSEFNFDQFLKERNIDNVFEEYKKFILKINIEKPDAVKIDEMLNRLKEFKEKIDPEFDFIDDTNSIIPKFDERIQKMNENLNNLKAKAVKIAEAKAGESQSEPIPQIEVTRKDVSATAEESAHPEEAKIATQDIKVAEVSGQPAVVEAQISEEAVRHIDLEKFPTQDQAIILKHIEQHPDLKSWKAGVEYNVKLEGGKELKFSLSHDLLKRERKEGKEQGVRYEVLHSGSLGSGASGIVRSVLKTLRPKSDGSGFEDRQGKTYGPENAKRAVKFVRQENKEKPEEFQERLDREGKMMREAGTVKSKAPVQTSLTSGATVMKRLKGKTLRDLINEGKLTDQERYEISIGLLQQIKQISDRGVVHRDIKPENIIVDTSKSPVKVRLFDFDVSVYADKSKESNPDNAAIRAGTQGYLAPEVRMMWGTNPTPAADVYAAATTLAQLWSGISFPTLARHMANADERVETMLDGCNPEIADILRKGRAPSIDERPSVGELIKSLEEIKPSVVSEQDRHHAIDLTSVLSKPTTNTQPKTGTKDQPFKSIKQAITFKLNVLLPALVALKKAEKGNEKALDTFLKKLEQKDPENLARLKSIEPQKYGVISRARIVTLKNAVTGWSDKKEASVKAEVGVKAVKK